MRLFDPSHDFFKPLITRIALVAVCYGWAAFEWSIDARLWSVLFGVLGTACLWEFFLNPANNFAKKTDRDDR